jgi:hypothetical protein
VDPVSSPKISHSSLYLAVPAIDYLAVPCQWAVPKFPEFLMPGLSGDLLFESCVPEVLFTIEHDFTIDGFTNAGSLL